MIEAVGRAVTDIAADPSIAVDAAAEEIPGTITDSQREIMQQVAEATVPLYGELTGPWGEQDADRWAAMADTMLELGLIENARRGASDAFSNEYQSRTRLAAREDVRRPFRRARVPRPASGPPVPVPSRSSTRVSTRSGRRSSRRPPRSGWRPSTRRNEQTALEISQLLYHLQVMMIARGLTPADVYAHL